MIRQKVKNHFEWLIAGNLQIQHRIENLYKFLNLAPLEETIYLPHDISIEVFKGKKRIMEAYENILKIGLEKRVFLIQGNRSVAAALKSLPKSFINYIQKGYREHKIILDGIIGESSLNGMKNLNPKDLKVYENRLVVAYVIDDNFIDFDMDILIFEKKVALVNYEKSLVVIIKNEEIYKVIMNMMEAMKTIARKIDLNKIIKELLETSNNSY